MSENTNTEPASAATVRAGDIIFQSPRVVANSQDVAQTQYVPVSAEESFVSAFAAEPGQLNTPGRPHADALFVLQAEPDEDIVAVRLGLMSTEAVANHLPELAEKLTKPKVFFIGGNREPVVLAVGLLNSDELTTATGSAEDSAETETGSTGATSTPASPSGKSSGGEPSNEEPSRKGQIHPSRFGAHGRFIHIHTGEDAPSVEEQVAAATSRGSSGSDSSAELNAAAHAGDGAELAGLRLFHSYVTIPHAQVKQWVECGLVGVEPGKPEDIFTAKPAETWRQLMKRRPFPENLFVTWASHPERN